MFGADGHLARSRSYTISCRHAGDLNCGHVIADIRAAWCGSGNSHRRLLSVKSFPL